VLGRPGTVILLGDSPLAQDAFSGGRFTGGMWLDQDRRVGMESTYFFLGEQTIRRDVTSAAQPILARPFFNLNEGVQSSAGVAVPGFSTGSFGFANPSRLQGAETNLLANAAAGDNYRVDLLAGFRYLDLRESFTAVQFVELSPDLPNRELAGNRTVITDQFRTSNHFYGGQVGLRGERDFGPLFVAMRGMVALGSNQQTIEIGGSRLVMSPATGTMTLPVGQLALPSNIGRFRRDEFAVVPEVGVNLGYRVTSHLDLFAGYTFLAVSRVVRPGEQIDLVTDVTQVPGPGQAPVPAGLGRPAVLFHTQDFWAQGINVGAAIHW